MSLGDQKICVVDLMKALREELDLECPFISGEEKALLIECMVWDILNRGDYLPALTSAGLNAYPLFSSFSDVQAK